MDVPRAVQPPDHIDSVVKRCVEDNIAPERKAAHARAQFVAGPAHHGLRRQQPELFIGAVHPAIGGVNAVVGDVAPDLEDVRLSKRPPRDPRHLCGRLLGGSAGACFSLDRVGVPGPTRPTSQPAPDIAAQLLQLCLPEPVLLFQQSQRLAHDFTGRGVQAGGDLRAHELFQLRGQIYVHAHEALTVANTQLPSYQTMSKIDISAGWLRNRAHSTFAPEIFTAGAWIALSAARKAVNSSGVLAMSS